MPAFEMTAEEQAKYGNAKLSIWQQLALLNSWMPLLSFAQRFIGAADPYAKSLIVAEACEWLASRTDSGLDDELVKHLAAMVATPQGEAMVRWVVAKIEGMQA